jgi:hypothetical protein
MTLGKGELLDYKNVVRFLRNMFETLDNNECDKISVYDEISGFKLVMQKDKIISIIWESKLDGFKDIQIIKEPLKQFPENQEIKSPQDIMSDNS